MCEKRGCCCNEIALPKIKDPLRSVRIDGLPVIVRFSSGADRPAEDYDVLMGYQIFLGRDPENSHVIQIKKHLPLRLMVQEFLTSTEFRDLVAGPLAQAAALPHESSGLVLVPEHTAWLTELIAVSESAAQQIADTRSWRSLFGLLAGIEHFPTELGQPSARAETRAPPPEWDRLPSGMIEWMQRVEALLQELNRNLSAMRADAQERERSRVPRELPRPNGSNGPISARAVKLKSASTKRVRSNGLVAARRGALLPAPVCPRQLLKDSES